MKIAIVDDENIWLQYVKKEVTSYWTDNITISMYSSGEAFLDAKEEFQVVFMDIEMPEKDGFTIIEEYRDQGKSSIVIILTTHTEMSRRGYQVEAFRYIDKLKIKEEMQEAFLSIDKMLERDKKIELSLKTLGKTRVILKKIIYFETELRDVKVHMEGEKYICTDSICELAKILEQNGFYLTHRSYLINLQWVKNFDKKEVIMKNGEKVILSSRKYQDFKEKYIQWKFYRANK